MDNDFIFCKGGGCTRKLGPDVLERVLSGLPKGVPDPDLLVGFDARDDAAVYRLSDDTAIVQTLDFFPPMIDDPYLFGQIAAANALSDIYAMGGRVKTALNIVCFPEKADLNLLGSILRGGQEKVTEAGGILAGGHSIMDESIKYGLSCMGTVHPDRILTNTGAQPGDALILTKPLGVGLICTAHRVGECSAAGLDEAVRSMTTLNRAASEAARDFTIHACTDVTGFGLLGHLNEMCTDDISVRVDYRALPVMEEALRAADAFLVTAAAQRNRNHLAGRVTLRNVPFPVEEVLYDPQTSGGLLFALPQEEADALICALHAAGVVHAAIAGEVLPRGAQTPLTVE
ncbi:MAG: selenide, water dikinase SelD [Lachnospiraceae bacterium]|nr:selenide, water dikinase SelD [Lachnospiraceae bacterium]